MQVVPGMLAQIIDAVVHTHLYICIYAGRAAYH